MDKVIRYLVLLLILTLAPQTVLALHPDAHVWTEGQKQILKSLWLGSLPPLPPDPSNRYGDNHEAVALGRKLFFDTRLSANGKVACATCHIPDSNFTDNLPVAHGMDDTTRRSMPLAGTAYSPWLFWDGRADSLWSQALGPIESPVEHGISRTKCAIIVFKNYRMEYEKIFGPMPEFSPEKHPEAARPAPDNAEIQALWDSMPEKTKTDVTKLYANIGKAIEAYVRTIMPGPSHFDLYVQALLAGDEEKMKSYLTPEEAVGLKLFIGKAQCINCHNGPLFTNNDFHKVGVPPRQGFPADPGRAEGIPKVLAGEFNCLSQYSDAGPGECAELKYMDTDTQKYEGAFKTPSLRNVADRPPYMHAGQFKTLQEVLHFYQGIAKKGVKQNLVRPDIAHGEINDAEVDLLEAFLRSLSGTVVAAQ